jgi:hypothetical protein
MYRLIFGPTEVGGMLFRQVFELVIGSDLKLSAEEIEMGLMKPHGSLAQLHIVILKVFYSYYSYRAP